MGVKEGVSRQLGRVGRKTSALLEEAKLRGSVASLESEVKRLYEAVGMTMFSMWKHEDVDTGRLVKHFEAIQRRLEEIEEKKEQIRKVRGDGAGKSGREESKAPAAERLALPDHALTGTDIPGGAQAADGFREEGTAAPAQGIAAVSEQKDPAAPAQVTAAASEQRDPAASEQVAAASSAETKTETAGGPVKAENVVIEEEDSDGDLKGVIKMEEAPRSVVYCTRCGSECPADANFCRKCGAKLK